MKQYIETIQSILTNGIEKPASRPGMPTTLQQFGGMMQIDLAAGFPLYTTKRTSLALTMHELNWFIKGHTSVKFLEYHNVRVWHDDSYNYYTRIAESVFRNASLNFQSDNKFQFTQLGMNFLEALNLLLVHDETVDTPVKYRPLTKEEYKKKLWDWGDNMRSLSLNDDQLDNKIIHSPIIHHDPRYVKDLLFTVTYGEYNTLYDFGDCGAQYGYLWRNLRTVDRSGTKVARVDQFKELIEGLKANPFGRRHIIDSWNPGTLNDMALNACHPIVQFDVSLRDDGKKYLSCAFFMRSNDMFLGNPYNVSFYALLTNIIAGTMGFELGTLPYFCGDQHLYEDHLDQATELITREPKPLPQFDYKSLAKYNIDDIVGNLYKASTISYSGEYIYKGLSAEMRSDILTALSGYDPMPAIKAPLSTGK